MNEQLDGPEYHYSIGDKVNKCTGDYHWAGIVRAVFTTGKGQLRYVVGHPVDKGECLHIYGHKNLERV